MDENKHKFRGYYTEYDGETPIFSDTKLSTVDTWQSRPCGECKMHNTPEGHDGCLGTLSNKDGRFRETKADVMNACCGHSVENEAYVQFWDGLIVRGSQALEVQKLLKGDGNDDR